MGARSQRGARKKQVRGSPVHAAEASQTATGFVHGVASIAPWKGVQMLTLEGEKDVLASGFTQRG